MRLVHLGLPVQDYQRSLDLYSRYFGFDPATVRRYEDGTMIVRNADDFELALHPDNAEPSRPEFLHFGFALSTADDVRTALARLDADSVPVVERYDEQDYVSFKCVDSDGWHVEVYWASIAANSA